VAETIKTLLPHSPATSTKHSIDYPDMEETESNFETALLGSISFEEKTVLVLRREAL